MQPLVDYKTALWIHNILHRRDLDAVLIQKPWINSALARYDLHVEDLVAIDRLLAFGCPRSLGRYMTYHRVVQQQEADEFVKLLAACGIEHGWSTDVGAGAAWSRDKEPLYLWMQYIKDTSPDAYECRDNSIINRYYIAGDLVRRGIAWNTEVS